jgi:glutamine---fructose-6-phosphate transaminase (isomerizing)
MTYMESEIKEQPQAMQRLLSEEAANIAGIAAVLRQKQPAVILIAARGTSDNAATYAKYLLGLVNGTIVALAAPSLTTLYGAKLNLSQAAVIGISQSGKSTDVVEVMQQAHAAGALTIGISNDPPSPLAAAVQYPIALRAGEEKALPATKTYTASLTALALLSAHLAGNQSLLDGLAGLPAAMQAVLQLEPVLTDAAYHLRDAQRCVSLARGINYATALEAALKLKETCYLGAEPYSTADFMHGPFAVVEPGFPALLFAPPGQTEAAMTEMAQALVQRGASSVTMAKDPSLLKLATIPVAMPVDVDERLSPILYILPGQLLALHLSQARGIDPDAPRSLNKVTLTR